MKKSIKIGLILFLLLQACSSEENPNTQSVVEPIAEDTPINEPEENNPPPPEENNPPPPEENNPPPPENQPSAPDEKQGKESFDIVQEYENKGREIIASC